MCHKYFFKLEKKTAFTICVLELRVHWCIIVFNPVVIIFQEIKKENGLLRVQLITVINGSNHINYTAYYQMSKSRHEQILPNVHTTRTISYSPHPSTSMPLNQLGCERVKLEHAQKYTYKAHTLLPTIFVEISG